MFKNYERLLSKYLGPKEERPFPNSIFPAASFNLSPKVQTVEHYNSKNKVEGWLAVTALGNFNPDAEKHLVL